MRQTVVATFERYAAARHGRDVGLHGGIAVGLRDLRVAAREEHRVRIPQGLLALGWGGAPTSSRRGLARFHFANGLMNTRSGPKSSSDEVVQAIVMAAIALGLLALLWLLP